MVLTTLLRAKGNEPWQLLGPEPFTGHPSVPFKAVQGSSWVQKHFLDEIASMSRLAGFHSPDALMCSFSVIVLDGDLMRRDSSLTPHSQEQRENPLQKLLCVVICGCLLQKLLGWPRIPAMEQRQGSSPQLKLELC